MTTLTMSELAPMMREAVKDKSYLDLSLGQDAGSYLRHKRKELAENSLLAYETTLDKFVRHFADLELKDFEPPMGTERLEEFLDVEWGGSKPNTYNRHLAVIKDFFRWQIDHRQRLHGDPARPIRKAKTRQVYRTTFSPDQRHAILASQETARDRLALRLLLDYGLRRGALQAIQFKHFDHLRKRLTIFTKGSKIRDLPIPDPAFWDELGRHIIEVEARPSDFLMPARRGNQHREIEVGERPMSAHGLHRWWYRCLARAGVVEAGVMSGEKMHKARHTAGQRVLDTTGNVVAVQKLLGHKSIQTTADTYLDHDIDQLAATMARVLAEDPS